MLLALFEIFFRVLKQCTQSGVQAQQAQGIVLGPVLSCHVMSCHEHMFDDAEDPTLPSWLCPPMAPMSVQAWLVPFLAA